MTKNEYLIDLEMKLKKLTDDPRGIYPELESLIAFYRELIEDKIEDGMTEDDAVNAMETPEEIAERLKSEFGAGDDAAATQQPRADGEKKHIKREFDAETVDVIAIRDENDQLEIRPGKALSIEYSDGEEGEYEVELTGGMLKVEFHPFKQRPMRRIFNFGGFGSRDVFVLTIPAGWQKDINAKTVNAKIKAQELRLNSLTLTTSNARMELERIVTECALTAYTSNGGISMVRCTANELDAKTSNANVELIDCVSSALTARTSNGSVILDNCKAEGLIFTRTSNARISIAHSEGAEVIAETSNGGVKLTDICAQKLASQSSNGKVELGEVTASTVSVNNSHGSIVVDKLSSGDITLVTSNSSITGNILGKKEDYTITSKTSNGSNNLPTGTAGEKKLDVSTSNGRIAIEFKD